MRVNLFLPKTVQLTEVILYIAVHIFFPPRYMGIKWDIRGALLFAVLNVSL